MTSTSGVDGAGHAGRAGRADRAESGDPWGEPIRGLVLDIDDTLVDTRSAMRAAGAVAAASALPSLGAEVHQAISDMYYDDKGGFFDAYTRGELAFAQMRRLRFEDSLQRLGLPTSLFESGPAYESAYLDAFAQVQRLFDDVFALFDAARDRGVAVCLLTNSGEEQTKVKLRAVGLEGVAPVVTTDTLGVGKPDPRLFAEACARIGIESHTAVCVGDTLETDVRGALGAGMRAAWLCRPNLPTPRNAGWGTPIEDPRVRVVATLHDVATLLT